MRRAGAAWPGVEAAATARLDHAKPASAGVFPRSHRAFVHEPLDEKPVNEFAMERQGASDIGTGTTACSTSRLGTWYCMSMSR
jgi:hypothetical protein